MKKMDLLPTGSEKVLEIQSGNLCIVVKSKNPHSNLTNKSILEQPSKLWVRASDVRSIKVFGEEKVAIHNDGIGASSLCIHTCPLFFEQTDYEIIIKSTDGKPVALWHENYHIRDKISPVTDTDDLISGIINFGNSVGFSEFEISCQGEISVVIRIEVFPSKISYKEDYQNMLQDISEEVAEAVLDFMGKTYGEFSIGSTESRVPALFFQIVQQIFHKFRNAAKRILASPHHKLYVEYPVVPAHKVKKIHNYTMKWLQKHPQYVIPERGGFSAAKAPTVKKEITYNTIENRYAKFMLKSTVQKLKDFRERYTRSTGKPEQEVLDRVDSMTAELNKYIYHSFLQKVDEYQATQSMSLVFEMAPGYRELYKYYLMMQRGLTVHGDVFRMSIKDTARLYEYWCFIKLVSIMKRNYRLASSDVIKVDRSGVTVALVKGKKSEVKFVNPRTGERITLAYNPGEQNTQTVNQTPDNVLTLEKRGTSVPYKYIFDAKYRIESHPEDPFYPDTKPGPKVSDINAMHRYRDAIVYENDTPSPFLFEKTMFGAYVLFPYDDPYGEYQNHRFYKSIETVNIGGIPFLPGTTELLENFLAELVEDSSESAFERASLPRGTEELMAKVDWAVKDVMVGTVRSAEQLQFNMEHKGYYVPARFVSDKHLPIRYIALYEQDLGSEDGIRVYGEVLTAMKMRRRMIPVTMRMNGDPEEVYYYFTVRKWEPLPQPILIQDSRRGRPQFTNKFLLDHCTKSYQLFSISSEEEYRLMVEINKAFDHLRADIGEDNTAVYRINDKHSVIVSEGYFTITNDNGDILDRISVSSFTLSPRAGFGRIKRIIG